jgi:uncharacterized protein (DUF1800 family)
MLDQTYLDTAHLLRRAGFGASPETVQAAAQAGLAATTDALLHPENGPQDPNDTDMIEKLADLIPDRKGKQTPVQFVKLWWTHRMLTTQHPLVEKMVLFWHGHFTSKLGDGEAMLGQNQLFRREALGNFRTLTLAVSRDPAMLKYLNGNQNYKAHPNENYGRELMELFTCGIGHYTEDDVKAAARAFSGWNLRQDEFYFNPRQHDDTSKTFLGKTGNWNGDDIVDILVAHPGTATRVCKQLFEYFAYADPEPAVLKALTQTYYASGYDIRAIVGQILRSNAFYSQKARNAIIKSPVQFVIGTVKMLGIEQAFDVNPAEIDAEMNQTANADSGTPSANGAKRPADVLRGQKVGRLTGLTIAMRSMGQDIFSPPSVKGWDGEEAWINSATLLNRVNFANRISQNRALYRYLEPKVQDYAQRNNLPETTAWVDYLAYALGPLQLAPAAHQTLIAFANGDGPYSGHSEQFAGDEETPVAFADTPAVRPRRRLRPAPMLGGDQGRMLALLPLIMATPEYQTC